MLKIWGHRAAPNVAKVLWTCSELALDHELIPTGARMAASMIRPIVASIPMGRIPTLDDDGFVLWESHAIMRYLARREGADGLYPKDFRAVALVDQWLDWQAAHLAQAVRDLVRLTIKATGLPPTEEVARAEAEADTLFGIVDVALQTSRFVAGAAFTLADIPIGIAVRRWTALPVKRAPLPALGQWFEKIKRRPGAALLSR